MSETRSNKPLVAITRNVPDPLPSMLREHYEVKMAESTNPMPPEQLQQFVHGADALVSISDDKVTADLLDAAGPQLKIVAQYAVGYDNIDMDAAISRKVWVTHTPGAENAAVAELTFGLALAVMRNIALADQFVREGNFKHWDPYLFVGPELARKTIGIVGLGRIGSKVAEIALGFDMQVIYYDLIRKHKLENALGAEFRALDDVFREADIVTLHVPKSPDTIHLANRERLGMMKRTAFLLNACRGPVVDDHALIEVLKAGRIAGAGLDVYEDEPHVSPELKGLRNVVLTPHLGSSTGPSREAMGRMTAESVIDALSGRIPINRVEGT